MRRVLVIDDEELARYTMREILESAGYEVVEAANGNQGLAHLRINKFDLVVTDIIMPEKDGIETIIELKNDFPEMTVIAVSGGGRSLRLDFLKLAKQYGATKVLAKPFSEEDLLASMEDCLNKAA
jgi:CheY-like chemotaxis protein